MKTITKHIFSATGHYVGCKEVPHWHSYVQLPTLFLVIMSILIGIGIIVALNGLPQSSHRPAQSITNDLPF